MRKKSETAPPKRPDAWDVLSDLVSDFTQAAARLPKYYGAPERFDYPCSCSWVGPFRLYSPECLRHEE